MLDKMEEHEEQLEQNYTDILDDDIFKSSILLLNLLKKAKAPLYLFEAII